MKPILALAVLGTVALAWSSGAAEGRHAIERLAGSIWGR